MPLSEYEQHVIEEIERELCPRATEDTRRTRRWRRQGSANWAAAGSIAALVGLSLVAYGLVRVDAMGTATALCGFALIVVAGEIGVAAARRRARTRRKGPRMRGVLRILTALRRYGPGPDRD